MKEKRESLMNIISTLFVLLLHKTGGASEKLK